MGGLEASGLIVGAGPVGLTLAIDLAWRGIDVTIAEIRRFPLHRWVVFTKI